MSGLASAEVTPMNIMVTTWITSHPNERKVLNWVILKVLQELVLGQKSKMQIYSNA
jgi:hypothetical protein